MDSPPPRRSRTDSIQRQSALNRRTAPIHSLSDARGGAGHEPPRQLRPRGKICKIFGVLAGPFVGSSSVRLKKESHSLPESIYGSLERRIDTILILLASHFAYALTLAVFFSRPGARRTPRRRVG